MTSYNVRESAQFRACNSIMGAHGRALANAAAAIEKGHDLNVMHKSAMCGALNGLPVAVRGAMLVAMARSEGYNVTIEYDDKLRKVSTKWTDAKDGPADQANVGEMFGIKANNTSRMIRAIAYAVIAGVKDMSVYNSLVSAENIQEAAAILSAGGPEGLFTAVQSIGNWRDSGGKTREERRHERKNDPGAPTGRTEPPVDSTPAPAPTAVSADSAPAPTVSAPAPAPAPTVSAPAPTVSAPAPAPAPTGEAVREANMTSEEKSTKPPTIEAQESGVMSGPANRHNYVRIFRALCDEDFEMARKVLDECIAHMTMCEAAMAARKRAAQAAQAMSVES